VVSGAEQLIGSTGQVFETGPAESWAHVHGESWKVVSKTPLRRGQQVRIVARAGLVLEVTPVAT
jgi:membrane-bound serine protease (ClpP class)